jgi:hypothetical protein
VRQGKHYVEVADGEQLFLASREPAATSRDLSLGTVPIATGVENDYPMATTGALMEMSTQRAARLQIDPRIGLGVVAVHDLRGAEAGSRETRNRGRSRA